LKKVSLSPLHPLTLPKMTDKKIRRRYIYDKTEQEITEWAERMLKEERMTPPPNGRTNFPYYLEQFINHLKDNQ